MKRIFIYPLSCFLTIAPVCAEARTDSSHIVNTPSFFSVASQQKKMLKTNAIRPKNPWIAAVASIIPGGGQLYNGKKHYWKAPIMVAGVGLLYVAVSYNADRYNWYREGYNSLIESGPKSSSEVHTSVQKYVATSDSLNLIRGRDFFLSQRDFWTIFMIVGWVANIIEAITSAHLSEFDIGDNLSLHIRPTFSAGDNRYLYANRSLSAGVAVRLTF